MVVCIGFTNGEYRIALVDFICSSRGRLERDRGFANPLSLSNTSPDPFGDPLRRGITAAAVDRDIVSLYPVLSLLANSEYCLAICVRLCIVRVSVGVLGFGRTFFIIGGVGRSFLRLRGVLLWSIVGITADREWVGNMADNGEGNRILSFHLQYGTVCYHYIGNSIPQSLPVEGGWLRPAARERST